MEEVSGPCRRYNILERQFEFIVSVRVMLYGINALFRPNLHVVFVNGEIDFVAYSFLSEGSIAKTELQHTISGSLVSKGDVVASGSGVHLQRITMPGIGAVIDQNNAAVPQDGSFLNGFIALKIAPLFPIGVPSHVIHGGIDIAAGGVHAPAIAVLKIIIRRILKGKYVSKGYLFRQSQRGVVGGVVLVVDVGHRGLPANPVVSVVSVGIHDEVQFFTRLDGNLIGLKGVLVALGAGGARAAAQELPALAHRPDGDDDPILVGFVHGDPHAVGAAAFPPVYADFRGRGDVDCARHGRGVDHGRHRRAVHDGFIAPELGADPADVARAAARCNAGSDRPEAVPWNIVQVAHVRKVCGSRRRLGKGPVAFRSVGVER